MRLFIAIQFDPAIMKALTELQDGMRTQGVMGNYTRPENLHLTLAFIGEYGNPDDVLDAMGQVPFVSFPIRLSGVGSYGELFWAGIEENQELASYVKRLRRSLSDAGIPFDRKRFSPHITLIRKASCRNGKKISASKPPAGGMAVRHISLMQSTRGKHGMIYTEIGIVGEGDSDG